MSSQAIVQDKPSPQNNETMAPNKQPYDVPYLAKLCLGSGDGCCVGYEDPRRLLGSNLPTGLTNIIADRLRDKADSDWESELDFEDETSHSDVEVGDNTDKAHKEGSRERHKRAHDDRRPDGRKRKGKEPFSISCLAFGCRSGTSP
jgi:hypothetical protein